jgi:hypothetical protein
VASSASDPFSKRAKSFPESAAPPGLEILLMLVSTNRPFLTELETFWNWRFRPAGTTGN